MFDVVARYLRDVVHHLIHSRDDILQQVCLFADDFVRDNIRERQNVLQPVQKIRYYLVVLVLCFQKLNVRALPSVLTRQQRAQTSNVTLATPKTAFEIGFNYKVSTCC